MIIWISFIYTLYITLVSLPSRLHPANTWPIDMVDTSLWYNPNFVMIRSTLCIVRVFKGGDLSVVVIVTITDCPGYKHTADWPGHISILYILKSIKNIIKIYYKLFHFFVNPVVYIHICVLNIYMTLCCWYCMWSKSWKNLYLSIFYT